MNDVMVRVENLGKLYYIGKKRQKADTLAKQITDSLSNTARKLFDSRLARIGADDISELWALKDISFELKRGDVLGIVGSNGSGKSTLLKILSHVTAPTTGRVELFGRVGSLLEVGTGFHPDLTGRENVYLNGAVLGMKSAQIDRLFDEIVDFSGVEKFIDTPVKHYSSGMYVRLAFSVAAHFDPEILILDEVLAVGDASFTRKSLQKMETATKNGKTVLFVSHALSSITRLCNQGIFLNQGKMVYAGNAIDTVSEYLKRLHQIDENRLMHEGGRPTQSYMELKGKLNRWSGSKHILTWISTHNMDDNPSTAFNTGDGMIIKIGYHLDEITNIYCNLNFLNYTGLQVMTVGLHHSSFSNSVHGEGYLECKIPELLLVSGNYIIMVTIGKSIGKDEKVWLDSISDTIHIKVDIGNFLNGAEVSQMESTYAQRSHWKIHNNSYS